MWTQPPKFYDVIQSIQRLLEYTEGREYEIQGGGSSEAALFANGMSSPNIGISILE